MLSNLAEIRVALSQNLVGSIINLQDVSDDGYEIVAQIVDIRFNDTTLFIKTEATLKREWKSIFHSCERNEFEGPFEMIEEAIIESDGRIVLISWGVYDYVYIRP